MLAVNAVFFGFGLFACSRSDDPAKTCPNIGARFDNYSEKALAAVLGLIAGANCAITLTQRASSSDDRDESLASPPPLQLQPSPKSSSEASPQARDQGANFGAGRPEEAGAGLSASRSICRPPGRLMMIFAMQLTCSDRCFQHRWAVKIS